MYGLYQFCSNWSMIFAGKQGRRPGVPVHFAMGGVRFSSEKNQAGIYLSSANAKKAMFRARLIAMVSWR